MKVTVEVQEPNRAGAELLAIALTTLGSAARLPARVAAVDRALGGQIHDVVKSGDFRAARARRLCSSGVVAALRDACCWPASAMPRRSTSRRCASSGARRGRSGARRVRSLAIAVPSSKRVKTSDAVRALPKRRCWRRTVPTPGAPRRTTLPRAARVSLQSSAKASCAQRATRLRSARRSRSARTSRVGSPTSPPTSCRHDLAAEARKVAHEWDSAAACSTSPNCANARWVRCSALVRAASTRRDSSCWSMRRGVAPGVVRPCASSQGHHLRLGASRSNRRAACTT